MLKVWPASQGFRPVWPKRDSSSGRKEAIWRGFREMNNMTGRSAVSRGSDDGMALRFI
jgi:hypothetical protein